MDELRSKGLAKMNEVYGWDMPDIEGDPYFDLTVEHLFGAIWTRPGLSMRDKRLMTLTVVAALGNSDLAEIQANAALQASMRPVALEWQKSESSSATAASGAISNARAARLAAAGPVSLVDEASVSSVQVIDRIDLGGITETR